MINYIIKYKKIMIFLLYDTDFINNILMPPPIVRQNGCSKLNLLI